jgi:phosphohistidine phosphatase
MGLVLILLRHAKAEPPEGFRTDTLRTLSPRGRQDSKQLRRRAGDRLGTADVVLCSPSRRTRQTLAHIRSALPRATVKFARSLYLASPDEILALVHKQPRRARTVLVIGHNPGLHDLALSLVGRAARGARTAAKRMATKFPTCALCVIEFDQNRWKDVGVGRGVLMAFATPRDPE